MNLEKICDELCNKLDLLIEKKFPSENINLNEYKNGQTYSMNYKGVEYHFEFKPNKGQISVDLEVNLQREDKDVEERVEDTRISNNKIEKSKYLRDQKITYNQNQNGISLNCNLKRIPKTSKESNETINEYWGKIIKPLMLGIYEEFYNQK